MLHYKKLSFSFRAECMPDVLGILSMFRAGVILKSLRDFTVHTYVLGEVDVVLFFYFFEGTPMSSFIASISEALEAMEKSHLELHVANETINFTEEYDGTRTYTNAQRQNILPRIAEKLDAIAFSTLTL